MSVSQKQPGKSPDQLRRERAQVEYSETRFSLQQVPTSQGTRGLVYVRSRNGGNYAVNDEMRCSCPDFQRRGVACKHVHLTRLWLENGTRETDPQAPAPFDVEEEARVAQVLRERETLWG